MTTYYISPIGNDSTGAGTLISPWQTVSKAFSSSTGGDTILVDSANGNLTWVAQDFTSARTLSSYGGGTAVLSGGSTTLMWSGFITVSNLQFQNFSGLVPFIPTGTSCTMSFTTCKFVSIVTDFGFFAFNGGCSNSAVTLQSCLFQNCESPVGPSSLSYFRIGNDTVGTTTISLTNCTVYSNVATGRTMPLAENVGAGTTPTIALTNNIIWNANGINTAFTAGSTITFSGSDNDILGYSSPPSLTGNISTDPLFVDVASSIFDLRPSSPCRDIGTAI